MASCTRGRCWRPRRTRGSRASTASAALEVPGVVAVLTAADLPLAGGSGRAAEPLAREEIVWSGQPVALVVAESEAAAEDGAALVDVDADPLPAVLDIEAALAADAPPVRVTATAGRTRAPRARTPGRPRATTATRTGRRRRGRRGAGADGDSPNVAVRQRIHGGDAAAALERSDAVVSGPVPHELGPPGVPGAAGGAGLGRTGRRTRRPFEHPGRVHGARRALQVARAPDRPHPRPAGPDRRRVRRQAGDLRAAGGRRRARAPRAPYGWCSAAPRTSPPPTRRPAS